MITYAFLAILFIASSGTLWYLISKKLPELIAIPDHVITERLHEESAKFHLFLLHIRAFFREDNYKKFTADLAVKLLRRLHIFLMRFDNLVVARLQHIREKTEEEKSDMFTPVPVAEFPAPAVVVSPLSIADSEIKIRPASEVRVRYEPTRETWATTPKIHPDTSQISMNKAPVMAEETAAMRVNARVVKVVHKDLPFFEREIPASRKRIRKSKIVPP